MLSGQIPFKVFIDEPNAELSRRAVPSPGEEGITSHTVPRGTMHLWIAAHQ